MQLPIEGEVEVKIIDKAPNKLQLAFKEKTQWYLKEELTVIRSLKTGRKCRKPIMTLTSKIPTPPLEMNEDKIKTCKPTEDKFWQPLYAKFLRLLKEILNSKGLKISKTATPKDILELLETTSINIKK